MPMRNIILSFMIALSFLMSPISQAQDDAGGGEDILADGLGDMYTVIGCGAGGAILGLSTLSFAEDPWDKKKNILVGGAIGIIVGVGVVAWSQANKSKNLYYDTQGHVPQPDNTKWRVSWHRKNHSQFNFNSAKTSLNSFNYTLDF